MPRTSLNNNITRCTPAGLDVTGVDVAADTANGNSVTYTDDLMFYVLNGDDAAITVTVPTPGTVGRAALAVSDIAVPINAGAWKLIGPFTREVVQSDGQVYIDYAGTTITGVMIAPLRAY